MSKEKEKQNEYSKRWYCKHIEEARESARNRYYKNKERALERHKEYTKTPMGRASYLVCAYKREDKKYNRGESDLTAKWVVENIFNKSCAHCGEEDWHKLGCNRLDNSKPHTKDNVEPCCGKCNLKLQETNRNSLGRFVS